MPSKSPAQSLLEKADKKANSSTGWFSSANTKFEEAGDLYQQAANAFKMEKLFKEAGDAHAREAECREKCGESNEAAQAWWNAAKAYKRTSPERRHQRTHIRRDVAQLIIHCSRYTSPLTNHHTSHEGWEVPSGCGPREGDWPNLPFRST